MICWGPTFPSRQGFSRRWLTTSDKLISGSRIMNVFPSGQILMKSHQSGNDLRPWCAEEPGMDAKAPSLGFSRCGHCCQCLGRGLWHANSAPPPYRHISHSAETDPDLSHAACEEAVCRLKCRMGLDNGNVYLTVSVHAAFRYLKHYAILLAFSGLSSVYSEIWGVRQWERKLRPEKDMK